MSLEHYTSLKAYLEWLGSNLFGDAQPHLHFWMLTLIICASGIGVVVTRNLVHAALLMSLCFVGVAGIFILLNAEFLAAVQVLIYAGAIVVLVIFAIMLSENIVGTKIMAHNRQSVTALAVAVVMGLIMIAILLYDENGYYIGPWRWWVSPERNDFPNVDNSVMVGKSLMSTYTLAFWVVSIILMIAMVGSLILARSEKRKSADSTDPSANQGGSEAK